VYCGVELPWDLEDLGVAVDGVVDETLGEIFDVLSWRSVMVVAVEEDNQLLIVR
jgi:hypothetical protein